jgi:hypothetical protein
MPINVGKKCFDGIIVVSIIKRDAVKLPDSKFIVLFHHGGAPLVIIAGKSFHRSTAYV